jgi:hypothetical protein
MAKGAAMKSPKDPVDHARTTRPHAGELMTDTKEMPALVGHWPRMRRAITARDWFSARCRQSSWLSG